MKFEIIGNQFVKDGQPIKIMSGAVHYFRNLPGTWEDIFAKLKALGCNCVETYCAWNMHEKQPGQYDFSGILDIAAFIRTAEKYGLMVIVRPGPYICAEWEFGGLPWWIQNDENIEIRCMNPVYIQHFDRYLDRLCDEVRPLLCTNGGPIIMMQCENEYGYYGDDREYLEYLKEGFIRRGIDVPLFTSDGTSASDLMDGTINGCLATLNFGSRVEQNFKAHDELFPDMPKMCMEMWDGWFDAWGDKEHHTTSAEVYAGVVDDMLKRGHVNMYMFIGGTNFGFTSGANHYETFTPDVTSYDYDAILTECGDVTPKYLALREVISKYVEEPLPQIPKNRPKKAYGKFMLNEKTGFFDNLDKLSSPIHSDVPQCMEKYGTGYGSPCRSSFGGCIKIGTRFEKQMFRPGDGVIQVQLFHYFGALVWFICGHMGKNRCAASAFRMCGRNRADGIDGSMRMFCHGIFGGQYHYIGSTVYRKYRSSCFKILTKQQSFNTIPIVE